LVVSTSCSLHVPLDVSTDAVTFARQKVDEVVALGRALTENDAVSAQPAMVSL
jgi:hypothetical protein